VLNGKPKRRLIWVPVIHSEADLGSARRSVKSLYVRLAGPSGWDDHVKKIDRSWQAVRKEIQALDIDYAKVRLYQDGLPDCGHEERIVKDLAKAGSQNHQLLVELMEKGAPITGTESSELLLEEYELTRQVLASMDAGRPGALGEHELELSELILEKRDRYIGGRISKTLKDGETGLIFLGLLHSLEGRLPPDIEVVCLGRDSRPLRAEPGSGGKGRREQKGGNDA